MEISKELIGTLLAISADILVLVYGYIIITKDTRRKQITFKIFKAFFKMFSRF